MAIKITENVPLAHLTTSQIGGMVGNDFSRVNSVLDCNAGCNLLHLITAMTNQGFGGWEKLSGIPGTMGTAIRDGIGAFGTGIKDFVTKVRALNSVTGVVKGFSNAECLFSYRASFFKLHPEWIITRICIALERVNSAESNRIIEGTIAEREKKYLQSTRTAGSFFMNPLAPKDICAMFEKESRISAG